MDPKTVQKRSFSPTHCFCTSPGICRRLRPEVLSQTPKKKTFFDPRSYSKRPSHALEKVLTNETPGKHHRGARHRCWRTLWPCSRATPIACSTWRSHFRDFRSHSADPPALPANEARFDALRRFPVVVAILRHLPTRTAGIKNRVSKHFRNNRGQLGPRNTQLLTQPRQSAHVLRYHDEPVFDKLTNGP